MGENKFGDKKQVEQTNKNQTKKEEKKIIKFAEKTT